MEFILLLRSILCGALHDNYVAVSGSMSLAENQLPTRICFGMLQAILVPSTSLIDSNAALFECL